MSRMESNGNNKVNPTKLCHIVKRPDFEGYGFNLHSEKSKPGQYIGKVDANSPAEAAGLKEGDRIIEVNGVNINQETHKQVVQRIKAISNEVRLLIEVVSDDGSSNKNGVKGGDSKAATSKATTKAETSRTQQSNNGAKSATVNNANNNNEILPHPQNENNFGQSTAQPHAPFVGGGASRPVACGVLELPMTAAEMRAKLMSKKKYDPKNEPVDLKKKFEIIQKL